MRINSIYVSVVTLFALGAALQTGAQPLAQRSFAFELHGDDPGEVFTFNLPPDPLRPAVVRLDGFFQNLVPFETGVRYDLWWTTADGTGTEGNVGTDFLPLTGSGQVPVAFEHAIGFTPATVFLLVEGGGPGDHFRFAGEFAIQQVPEPGVFALLGAGAIAGLLWRRFRKANTHAA